MTQFKFHYMKYVGALSLMLLLTMSGFTPLLVSILPRGINNTRLEAISPLLVMFGNSPAEITARDQLIQDFPSSMIIDYSNYEMIIEFIGPIIYIGHSSVKGIGYNGQIVNWDTIASIIYASVSENHYILGCNSETISFLTESTGKNVISFGQDIDASLGASIVAYSIANAYELNQATINNFLGKAFNRMVDITINPDLSLPLKLWGQEIYTMGPIFFALVGTLYPLTGAVLGISGAIFVTTSLGVIAALFTLVNYAKNGGSAAMILTALSVIVKFMFQIMKNAILKSPWWRQASGFSALSADTVKNALVTIVVVLAVAVAIAMLVYYMTLFLYDVVDADNTYW